MKIPVTFDLFLIIIEHKMLRHYEVISMRTLKCDSITGIESVKRFFLPQVQEIENQILSLSNL